MRIRDGLTVALLLALCVPALPAAAGEGKAIFDGKTLEGWDGDPKFWSVEDGAITGRTTKDNPTKGNTFLVFDKPIGDFVLELDYKIVGGNSGIQYRSFKLKNAADQWRLGGYQADIDSGDTYSGIVYGERARGILVGRGESGTIAEGGKKSAERFAASADVQKLIKKEDWNHYKIVAKGNHLTQYINGVKTSELVDNDAEGEGKRMASGLLGLQLHQGPPMVVQFKNIHLQRLDAGAKKDGAKKRPAKEKETAGLRIEIGPRGTISVDGKAVADLERALLNAAETIRDRGVTIEAAPSVDVGDVQLVIEKCQKCGIEKFQLRASRDGVSLTTDKGRIAVAADGSIDASAGQYGVGIRDGKVALRISGFTVATFGEGSRPLGAAEVPVPVLGGEGDLDEGIELDLGTEGDLDDVPLSDIVFESEPLVDVRVAKKAKPRKVVFIAGVRSHGYGSHEHKAGCMLLAEHLEKSGLPIETVVVTEGWPKDASVLDDADSIVVYADGGGRHPFNAHIDELNELTEKGVGIVCIHYGVEVPKGKSGEAFLDWTGGYFETDWSVNPHWDGDFDKLPKHPTTRGVKPFKVNDEWYYHMRFREQGVTPILTDLPPKETLKRKDGPHSGNPAVRKAVLEDMEPQHVAWATERKDGGRGFGITGGHFHWNWGNDQMRKLMLNAIAWSAKVEVPEDGVPTGPVTVKDLMANQDYDPPGNFNPSRIEQMLKQWNAGK